MFLPAADGGVVANFSTDETQLVTSLAGQVGALIAGRVQGSADPAIARLFPSVYPDDADADAEFRRFTESELAARKVRNAETVISTLGDGTSVQLTALEALDWLQALTDIRLTLAARLGIEKDDDVGNFSSEEDYMMRDVYDWLGYVQESLVRAVDA